MSERTQAHVILTQPNSDEDYRAASMVFLPGRFCLTYLADLVPHLRKGTKVTVCADTDLSVTHSWRHTCT